ncbi:MAG TPA: DMT family transporter [Rectinemataceae bacterium]|nr:DMT family transporter [Rectinemataceae bacterium]
MPAIVLALVAIAIWSSLALLSTATFGLPPLFTTGIALVIGGLVGLVRLRDWKVSLVTFAVGLGGIFGYHALLFAAFSLAPPVEVNILNYLWPLLIVVLSPLVLPGLGLSPRHVAGAFLGLAGAVLVASGGEAGQGGGSLIGLGLAATAALVWALYSLMTKRLPPFPTGAVGGFCLASGLLSLGLLALTGGPAFRLPSPSPGQWLALLALGIGPMGAAFYAWDASLKRGDPRVIGSLAYLTPLLSTFNLVVFGGKRFTALTAAALVLIVGGALLGSSGSFKKKAARMGAAAKAG